MCGIVGYIGNRQAYPILIKGLKRLEYRGHDNIGGALINEGRQLDVYKTKGKVVDLEMFAASKDVTGIVGVAHTRWATHGEPSSINAHPHYSSSGRLALIHNGIIENYAILKEKLPPKGFVFKSNTDTEVLVQLTEYIQHIKKPDLFAAVQLALREVLGAYAIAVLDRENPDEIVVARKNNPLVIGIGNGEYFFASEGALKLKEVSYIHAEGYPAAEMKHGSIALIDAEMPVVVIPTQDGLYEKVLSNVQEIKARKGRVIALVTERNCLISQVADVSIELSATMEFLELLLATIPLQLLAYHMAVCKGRNVDQPCNLAKSVTVE